VIRNARLRHAAHIFSLAAAGILPGACGGGSGVTTPVLVQNNVFAGAGTVTNQASATLRTNYQRTAPGFADRASDNLTPQPGSPLHNAGSAPGTGGGMVLEPISAYRPIALSPMASAVHFPVRSTSARTRRRNAPARQTSSGAPFFRLLVFVYQDTHG
jgi:hypothetical protein